MKRILVTGGTGFIGSWIVRELVEQGNFVRVLDDNSRGRTDRLSEIQNDLDLQVGSIQNKDKVLKACDGVDQVIHLAYINGTRSFYERPGEVMDVAVRGFLTLVDAMRAQSVPMLVLASSSEVYQEPSHFPTTEEVNMVVPDLTNPRFSYGLGKIFQEYYSYHTMSFLDQLLIFRPHNIYGPDMGDLHVIPQLIAKCSLAKSEEMEFRIEGDGSQTRSFCYISDFIDGFNSVLKLGSHKTVYNIGNDSEVSILEVAQKISALMGYMGKIGTSDIPRGSTFRRLPDISRLRKLGYSPKIDLDQGLAKCIEGFVNAN